MILLITKLQRGTTKARTNQVYEGLYLAGWKQNRDAAPEMYDKFLYDWKDATFIQELEQIGIGGAALIKMVRNGRFWDMASVEQWRGGGVVAGQGDPGAQQNQNTSNNTNTQPSLSAGTQGEPDTTVNEIANLAAQAAGADQIIRSEALKLSVDMVGSMLRSDPRFKKLLLVSTTSALLGEILIDYAFRMENFIKNGVNAPTSDPSELSKEAAATADKDTDDPYAGEAIPEDDIPF